MNNGLGSGQPPTPTGSGLSKLPRTSFEASLETSRVDKLLANHSPADRGYCLASSPVHWLLLGSDRYPKRRKSLGSSGDARRDA